MTIDRYTKVILTLIAIGLWANFAPAVADETDDLVNRCGRLNVDLNQMTARDRSFFWESHNLAFKMLQGEIRALDIQLEAMRRAGVFSETFLTLDNKWTELSLKMQCEQFVKHRLMRELQYRIFKSK